MSNIVTVNLKTIGATPKFVVYASYETEPTKQRRAIAFDLDVLKQELDSLFSTHKYERPYLPEYYNPLEELLGDLWTDTTETEALHLVTNKIGVFIPRVSVNNATNFTYNNYKVYMNLIISYNNDITQTLYNYEREFDTVT